MYLYREDANTAALNRYLAEEAAYEAKCPVCEKCDNPITDEYYYDVDGEILCEECMNDKYRRYVDDYIEDHKPWD